MKSNLKRHLKNGSTFIIVLLSLALTITSCSSTEVIQPDSHIDSKSISIFASTIDALPSTKASVGHSGMKLRYTAKLFSGKEPTAGNFLERQEMLATEAATKPFTFIADKTGEYCVAIFADYIKEDAEPDSSTGFYPDWHYDTSKKDDYINMLGLRADASDKMNASQFLNNDDFDCFYCLHKFEKTANAYEEKVTLKRAVCKIRVCGSGGDINNIDNIKITNLIYLSEFSFLNGWGGSPKTIDFYLPEPFSPLPSSDNEIFYFYSFSSSNDKLDNNYSISFRFEINGKEGYEFNAVESGSLKKTKKNTIYKISGDFLRPTNSPSNLITIDVTAVEEDWGETI